MPSGLSHMCKQHICVGCLSFFKWKLMLLTHKPQTCSCNNNLCSFTAILHTIWDAAVAFFKRQSEGFKVPQRASSSMKEAFILSSSLFKIGASSKIKRVCEQHCTMRHAFCLGFKTYKHMQKYCKRFDSDIEMLKRVRATKQYVSYQAQRFLDLALQLVMFTWSSNSVFFTEIESLTVL